MLRAREVASHAGSAAETTVKVGAATDPVPQSLGVPDISTVAHVPVIVGAVGGVIGIVCGCICTAGVL